MTHPTAYDEYVHQQRSPWSERDASDRRAMLTEILAPLCAEIGDGTRDHVSRYGDEGFVLMSGHDLDDAQRLGVVLCRHIEALAISHPASVIANWITVSAARPGPRQPPESLIAVADRALYMAKAQGRNGVVALSCM